MVRISREQSGGALGYNKIVNLQPGEELPWGWHNGPECVAIHMGRALFYKLRDVWRRNCTREGRKRQERKLRKNRRIMEVEGRKKGEGEEGHPKGPGREEQEIATFLSSLGHFQLPPPGILDGQPA